MSSKEVTNLRKSGKLNEALELSNQLLETEPDSIWNKRAASWVYYEFVKENVQPVKFDVFKEYLLKMKNLELPEDEKMVFDNTAWQIGKMVYSLIKEETVDYRKINETFNIIKDIHFIKPSEGYSFIFKAFLKCNQNWGNFLAFADWWNFDNFRSEDYQKEEFNGKKIMSIVEQAYIAYSKKLIEGNPIDQYGRQIEVDIKKVRKFLPNLEALIERQPSYIYPPYYKAKLLILLGDKENAISTFLHFAKQRKNDFWVWDIFTELYSEEKEIQFACYCKALSLKAKDEYLIKIRQEFAGVLVERQMYNEAKTEINLCVSEREKQGWKIPNQLVNWTNQVWYESATINNNNSSLYNQHLKKAEVILYQDIQEETIVVEFVNKNKKMLSFIKNKKKYGFFKYSEYLDKPQIGDIIKVRFDGEGQEGFYKILSVEYCNQEAFSEAIMDFEGTLNIRTPNNFGFVNDVFVEPKLVEDNSLKDGQFIKGKAILNYNKKKDSWGWKVFKLNKQNLNV